MSFTLDSGGMVEFCRTNQSAMLLQHQAAYDYAGCRCCLLNGLPVGLVLGSQAIEKLLKAVLLFADATLTTAEIRTRFGHRLPKLAEAVQKTTDLDLTTHVSHITALDAHYLGRYPDNPGRSTSQSTSELAELDLLAVDLLVGLPIPEEVKLRSGVFSLALISSERGVVTSFEKWLLEKNEPLGRLMPNLRKRNKAWLSVEMGEKGSGGSDGQAPR